MSEKMSQYEKKLEYNNAYNRKNYRSFSVRFDKTKEKDMIRWLEKQPGLKKYLVGLIEEDMKRKQEEKEKKKKKND